MTPDDLATMPAEVLSGEHEVQVRLLSAIEMLIDKKGFSKQVNDALAQLVDYTGVHFLSEELLMRLYSYPLHNAHERRHRELLDRLQELRDELERGKAFATGSLVNNLRLSIIEHIATEDAAFSKYLADLKID